MGKQQRSANPSTATGTVPCPPLPPCSAPSKQQPQQQQQQPGKQHWQLSVVVNVLLACCRVRNSAQHSPEWRLRVTKPAETMAPPSSPQLYCLEMVCFDEFVVTPDAKRLLAAGPTVVSGLNVRTSSGAMSYCEKATDDNIDSSSTAGRSCNSGDLPPKGSLELSAIFRALPDVNVNALRPTVPLLSETQVHDPHGDYCLVDEPQKDKEKEEDHSNDTTAASTAAKWLLFGSVAAELFPAGLRCVSSLSPSRPPLLLVTGISAVDINLTAVQARLAAHGVDGHDDPGLLSMGGHPSRPWLTARFSKQVLALVAASSSAAAVAVVGSGGGNGGGGGGGVTARATAVVRTIFKRASNGVRRATKSVWA